MEDKRALRKNDIVSGLLLFVVGAAMFAIATTYPMTENYGGVKNVWFVSPALFPLIIAALLMIFSLVLAGNGIRYLLAHPRAKGTASIRHERLYPFLFITLTLVAFVYFYIPSVDFYIATLVYLFLFIANFFVPGVFTLVLSGAVFVGAGLLFAIMAHLTPPESLVAQFWRDGLCTMLFAGLIAYAFRRAMGNYGTRRALRTILATCLIFVTFMVTAFKFGVLIPMPREGLYCYYMDEAYFTAKDHLKSED